jgi:anti-sigma factor RsiW
MMMAPEAADQCPDPEELLDYLDRRLDRAGEAGVEEHVAACDGCAERARLLWAFAALWDGWAEMLAGSRAAERLPAGLVAAAGRVPQWRGRLGRWWARLVTDADAVRAVIEAAAGPQPGLALAGAGAARPLPVLGNAMRVVVKPGATAEVEVPENCAGLEVEARDYEAGEEGSRPLAWLMAIEKGGGSDVTEFAAASKEGWMVAAFRGVGPGRYVLTTEPPLAAEAGAG